MTGDVLDAVLHIHIGVVAVFVEFQDFLAVLLDALLVNDIARFDLQITAHAVERDLFRAFDDDLLHDWAALEKHRHANAVPKRFGEEADIRDAAGFVKGADILLGGAFAVGLADFRGEVRQHAILGNTRGAYGFDDDVINDRAGLFGGRLSLAGEHGQGEKSDNRVKGKKAAWVFHG